MSRLHRRCHSGSGTLTQAGLPTDTPVAHAGLPLWLVMLTPTPEPRGLLVDFGYTEIPAVELAQDFLLHHFDDLVDACAALLNGPRSDNRLL